MASIVAQVAIGVNSSEVQWYLRVFLLIGAIR